MLPEETTEPVISRDVVFTTDRRRVSPARTVTNAKNPDIDIGKQTSISDGNGLANGNDTRIFLLDNDDHSPDDIISAETTTENNQQDRK